MTRAWTAVVVSLSIGCATGGQEDGAPRGDTGHGEDASVVDAVEASVDAAPGEDVADSTAPSEDASADSAAPDSTAPDTLVADTLVADTLVADTFVADTFVADTFVADTSVPETPEVCNTDKKCGASCTDCTATGKTCSGGTTCVECTVDATCGGGRFCMANSCVACDTAARCGPSCVACSGATPTCGGAVAGCTGTVCPSALTLGFASSADSWTFDGLWRYDATSTAMYAGSSTKYSGSYTQNLTSPSNVDLSSCAAPTLSYSVKLADDPDYSSKGPDKSERLYVQCSGDGGTTWNNLTPTAWPTNQSACATSYCCGGPGSGRSFALTSQTANLPAACRTATARFRFQAKGSSAWNMQNPAWVVDNVKVN